MERTNSIRCSCDPNVNTRYFCTFDDATALFDAGYQGSQSGPLGPNCAVFNKIDCANNWDERCEFLSKDPRGKGVSSCSILQYDNKAASAGDDLVVEAARTRFCKIINGKPYEFQVLAMDSCSLRAKDVSMGTGFAVNDIAPKELEKDPLYIKMINRKLGDDIVMAVYTNAINKGYDLNGTRTLERVNSIKAGTSLNNNYLVNRPTMY